MKNWKQPPSIEKQPPQTFKFPYLAAKSDWISVKTSFFFFFWRPPDFGRKKPLNFRFRPKNQSQFRRRPFFYFFWDHLIWGGKDLWISELSEKFRLNFRTNRVKLIQEQWKFGSRSFALFSLFQKSPPFSKFWLRAWSIQYNRRENIRIYCVQESRGKETMEKTFFFKLPKKLSNIELDA